VGGAEARGNTSSAVSEEKPEGATTANDQIYRARKQALAARAAMRRADWAVRTRNELDEALKPTHAVDFEDLTRNPLWLKKLMCTFAIEALFRFFWIEQWWVVGSRCYCVLVLPCWRHLYRVNHHTPLHVATW
jgi:hypothetical protein